MWSFCLRFAFLSCYFHFCSQCCMWPGINGLSSWYLISQVPQSLRALSWLQSYVIPGGPDPDSDSCPITFTPLGGPLFCARGPRARAPVAFSSHDSSVLSICWVPWAFSVLTASACFDEFRATSVVEHLRLSEVSQTGFQLGTWQKRSRNDALFPPEGLPMAFINLL